MSKQESVSDYYQMAKEIAKVEKELDIENWCRISIERDGDKAGEYIRLYYYDLPRHIAEKYEWVIRWRAAKLQCQFPKYCVRVYRSPYRKVMGCNIGMQEDINRFVAAKAQVSKQERVIAQYVDQRRKDSDMFYNESEDEDLIKAKEKLQRKKEQVAQAEARMIEKVKEYKNKQSNKTNNNESD